MTSKRERERERERGERERVYLWSELYFVIVEQRGGSGWRVYCRWPAGRNSVANDTPLTCWNILWKCHSRNCRGGHHTSDRRFRTRGRPQWMFYDQDGTSQLLNQWRTLPWGCTPTFPTFWNNRCNTSIGYKVSLILLEEIQRPYCIYSSRWFKFNLIFSIIVLVFGS